jgi:hypothetical protein
MMNDHQHIRPATLGDRGTLTAVDETAAMFRGLHITAAQAARSNDNLAEALSLRNPPRTDKQRAANKRARRSRVGASKARRGKR